MQIKKDLLSINFTLNGIKELRGIVLHSMWGTYEGSIAWFKNPDSGASAHYLISAEGEITQMVKESDMAWHAGIIDDVAPLWVRPNPNWYCPTPETKILKSDLTWVRADELKVGDKVVGFDEEPREDGKHRHFQEAEITAAGERTDELYEIILSDGNMLRCNGEHKWIARRSRSQKPLWWKTEDIYESMQRPEKELPFVFPRYFSKYEPQKDYLAGFLASAYDGEGSINFHNSGTFQLTFSQKENTFLKEVKGFLNEGGFEYTETKRKDACDIRLLGGRKSVYEFLMRFRPSRLLSVYKKLLKSGEIPLSSEAEPELLSIKRIGEGKIVTLSSSTMTYVAEGFGSHNTIGIELEDKKDPNWQYPEVQKKAARELVSDILKRYKLSNDDVLLHKEINPSRRSDPVGAFSREWLFKNSVSEKRQLITDILVALKGKTSENEIDAWEKRYTNPKDMIEEICINDGGYKKKWLDPAINMVISKRDNYWQSQLESAKKKKVKQYTEVELFTLAFSKIIERLRR